MKKQLTWMLLCISAISYAQSSITEQSNTSLRGVRFDTFSDWEQVKARAKAENKYIFLDCFATWCGPCKRMDKEVYVNEAVAALINEKYIAVKVQMDKTPYDDELVKKWYETADHIKSNFTVTSFPTYLFFSPDAHPLHRSVGYKSPQEFIAVIKAAFDPAKQYYSILFNFQPGKMDTAEMRGLIYNFLYSGTQLAQKLATDYFTRIPQETIIRPDNLFLMKHFSKDSVFQELAGSYVSKLSGSNFDDPNNIQLITVYSQVPKVKETVLKHLAKCLEIKNNNNIALLIPFRDQPLVIKLANDYLSGLSEKQMYTKDNIEFIAQFMTDTKNNGFSFFYNHGKKVDSVMGIKGYAETTVDNIIAAEIIDPHWQSALNGDSIPWTNISEAIKQVYGQERATRIVAKTKALLYKHYTKKYNTHWQDYINYNLFCIENYETDTTNPFVDILAINNFAFDAVFYHSTDTGQINMAIKLMEGVIRRNPTIATTIDTYANLLYKSGRKGEAISWQERALRIAKENNDELDIPLITKNLVKMKKGEPTWTKD